MDKTEFLETRADLMKQADNCTAIGDTKTANYYMDQVEKLDAEWDEIRTAQANDDALNGVAPVQNVNINFPCATSDASETADNQIDNFAQPVDKTNSEREVFNMSIETMNPAEAYKTDLYANAWAKTLMGKPLTVDENNVYTMVNASTLETGNTGEIVPESVASGIWQEIEESFPFYADITKTSVNGILTIIKAKESSDAKWYDEDTETEDGTETFETFQLNGCELARAITVSWKLKEMSIAEFIPYIQSRMAERMGAALGYGVMSGAGPDADKPEPTGVITALEADGNQVVKGELSYKLITSARAKIYSGYSNGVAIYANAETIWDYLANVVDENGHPLFIHDAANEGGVYRVLGSVVKEDSSVPTGKIVFGNAARGYHANINKQITLVTEDHAKARTTDYVGYAVIDGAPLTYKAFALIDIEDASDDSGSGDLTPTSAKASTDTDSEVATASAKKATK